MRLLRLRRLAAVISLIVVATGAGLVGGPSLQAHQTDVDQSQTGDTTPHTIFTRGQTFVPGKYSLNALDVKVQGRDGEDDIPDEACIKAYIKTYPALATISDPNGEQFCWTEFFAVPPPPASGGILQKYLQHIHFDPIVWLTPGTTYAIIFTDPDGSPPTFNLFGDDGYGGGGLIDANGALQTTDIYFLTYYDPNFEDPDADGVCVDEGSVVDAPHCSGKDLCPGTAAAALVDVNGCAKVQVDGDLDGVCDAGKSSPIHCTGTDLCPATPPAQIANVDADGCVVIVDTDGDGVCDPGVSSPDCTGSDACPDTPLDQRPVDQNGCSFQQLDTDGDGFCEVKTSSLCVGLVIDVCKNTPAATPVNPRGCSAAQVTALQPKDSDLDGVCNRGVTSPLCTGSDLCSNSSLTGGTIDSKGCLKVQVDGDGDGVCNRGVTSDLHCTGSDLCPTVAGPGTANGCPAGGRMFPGRGGPAMAVSKLSYPPRSS